MGNYYENPVESFLLLIYVLPFTLKVKRFMTLSKGTIGFSDRR